MRSTSGAENLNSGCTAAFRREELKAAGIAPAATGAVSDINSTAGRAGTNYVVPDHL
jgi:hypothetical protein